MWELFTQKQIFDVKQFIKSVFFIENVVILTKNLQKLLIFMCEIINFPLVL